MPKTLPLLLGFPGRRLSRELVHHLRACRPAGLVLFARNIVSLEQTGRLIKELREEFGPLWIGVDHEGGAINRFGGLAPVPPSPRALGRTGRIELVRRGARQQAELLAYLGLDLNFAPVLDLYSKRSPVIGNRAYGPHPGEVARFGLAVTREHLKLGVLPVGKHFPGHGRSQSDSHFHAGEVKQGQETLKRMELLPFKELAQAGLPALMTAHLRFPALDAGYPATFSKLILNDLLRQQWGYKGLILTDCLEMAATKRSFSPLDMARLGSQAGLDLWLSSFSLAQSFEFQRALARALERYPQESRETRLTAARGLISSRRAALPTETENHALWEASLSIQGARKFGLLRGVVACELLASPSKGINQGQANHPLKAYLEQARLPPLAWVGARDFADLAQAAEQARQSQSLFLLISTDLHCRSVFPQLKTLVQEQPRCLHLVLGKEQGCVGGAIEEWLLRGFNPSAGRFLAMRLERRLQSS